MSAVSGTKIAHPRLDTNFKYTSINAAIARTASSAFAISIIWIALELTSSTVISGFADGMVSLPLFLSFIFGAYIDRLKTKRKLAILTTVVRALFTLTMIVAVLVNIFWIRVLAIYSVAFVIGMTSDILNSVRASWSKQFLLESQYKSGISMLESLTSVAQGIGYAISGAILTLGIVPAVYGIALIFILSVIPLLRIRDVNASMEVESEPFGVSIRSGLSYIIKSEILRAGMVILLFVNLAFGTVGIFFAYLVHNEFGLSAIYYGFLFISLIVGIIIGSVFAVKIKGKLGFYNALFIFTIGTLIASMSLIGSITPDYAITFAIGLMIGFVNVISQAGIISRIKHEMMGRVTGAFSTFGLSVTFLSGGIGGLLIRYFSLHWAFVIVGVIISTVAVLSIVFREYYNLRI